MSQDLSTSSRRNTSVGALSTRNRIGLGLAGLLGLADIAGLAAIGAADPGTDAPPTSVLIAAAVLGVVTLIAVVVTWRTGNRVGARVVAGSRILSAITALPAFFVGNVPPGLIALATALVLLSLIAVTLVLSRPAAG